MFLVGVTGGVASGKSTVSKWFRDWNAPIVDADLIAREVVEPGKPAWKQVRQAFGEEYFFPTGELNRKKLGALVFADVERRKQLNRIVHKYIRWEMAKRIFWLFLTGYQFAILDLPLLFESGWQNILQYVIVVNCDEKVQVGRLMQRDGSNAGEALQRISAQMPLSEKAKRATYVIDNSGEFDETRRQAEAIFRQLKSSRLHWLFRFVFVFSVAAFASLTFLLIKRIF